MNSKISPSYLIFLSMIILLTPLLGCGSGGGDGDSAGSSGAAQLSLSTSPNSIDVQDRTRVRIKLEDVNRNGIVLKLRFPSKLEYVAGTTLLTVDGESKEITPDVSAQDGSKRYLVYFLKRNQFGDAPDADEEDLGSSPGVLTIELVGRERLVDGVIEIDADVDDPTIDNSVEFNINEPAFQAEAEASIAVED